MLTAAEYHMRETLPIHRIQEAIFDFCRHRLDMAVFGAQAVNFYVDQPRMTQDVDILCTDPSAFSADLARSIGDQFHVAIRVRQLSPGKAYRVFQLRSEGNRHLADLRLAEFPLTDLVERDGIHYVGLPLLIALKVVALAKRRLAPKGATDLADLRRMLLSHPNLRHEEGPVADAIHVVGGGQEELRQWRALVEEKTVCDEDSDEGY
ncbi:MAG: hypothetical protein ABUS79_16890 [Pseudomonadota bacterium]